MKAILIISTEYHLNQPSVFMMAEGQYYGDLIYPKMRNFPSDETYWAYATGSDSDRHFKLTFVEYSTEIFEKIQKLQAEIKENEECKKVASYKWLPRPASKRGKAWKEYVAEAEKMEEDLLKIIKYNEPFEKIISDNSAELRSILLSSNEN